MAEERARIAAELHDVVARALRRMVRRRRRRRAARRRQTPARAALAFAAVEQTGRDALAEIRRLLGVLRREDDELALAPQPTLAHVADLVRRARAAGLPWSCASRAPRAAAGGRRPDRLPRRAGGAAGAMREGAAAGATVTVRYGADAVELEVLDDGRRGRRRWGSPSASRSTAASCARRAARRRPGPARAPAVRERGVRRPKRLDWALAGDRAGIGRRRARRSPRTCAARWRSTSSPWRPSRLPLAWWRTRPLRATACLLRGRGARRMADLGRRPPGDLVRRCWRSPSGSARTRTAAARSPAWADDLPGSWSTTAIVGLADGRRRRLPGILVVGLLRRRAHGAQPRAPGRRAARGGGARQRAPGARPSGRSSRSASGSRARCTTSSRTR